jgi:hypothetical protein
MPHKNTISHGVSTYWSYFKRRKDGEIVLKIDFPVFFEDAPRRSILRAKIMESFWKTVNPSIECMTDEQVKLEFEKIQSSYDPTTPRKVTDCIKILKEANNLGGTKLLKTVKMLLAEPKGTLPLTEQGALRYNLLGKKSLQQLKALGGFILDYDKANPELKSELK